MPSVREVCSFMPVQELWSDLTFFLFFNASRSKIENNTSPEVSPTPAGLHRDPIYKWTQFHKITAMFFHSFFMPGA